MKNLSKPEFNILMEAIRIIEERIALLEKVLGERKVEYKRVFSYSKQILLLTKIESTALAIKELELMKKSIMKIEGGK